MVVVVGVGAHVDPRGTRGPPRPGLGDHGRDASVTLVTPIAAPGRVGRRASDHNERLYSKLRAAHGARLLIHRFITFDRLHRAGPEAWACLSVHPGSDPRCVARFTESILIRTASTVILVVEDDDCLRQLLLDSLEGHQYWVLSARNGEEAWDLFNEHWPIMSLLITEVVLPGMDGLVLAARARELVPDLPALYMAREDQLSEAVRQGVENTRNSYLMKPFDHEYLLLKVRAALKG